MLQAGDAEMYEPRPASYADFVRVMGGDPPVRIAIIGAVALMAVIHHANRSRKALNRLSRDPEARPVRIAFSLYDRIRTGELPAWHCLLCEQTFHGQGDLCALAVTDHPGDTADKPSLTAFVCLSCDSVGVEDTERRIYAALNLTKPN
jgi:hypothetical protein